MKDIKINEKVTQLFTDLTDSNYHLRTIYKPILSWHHQISEKKGYTIKTWEHRKELNVYKLCKI